MRFNFAVLSVIMLLASFGSLSSSAGIVLSFAPTNPSPLLTGSSGTLDVLIHSDASDVLEAFQVEFTLTPIGPSPVGGLEFSAMQLDSQLTELNYVFYGNSLSFETSQSVGTVIGGDVFKGYDATFDFNPATLSGTEQLLFRLNLDGVTSGSYSIGVLSAIFLKDQLLADPSDPSFPDNVVPYSSTPGEITVASTTAVPEPSGAVLLGLAIAIGLFYRRTMTQPDVSQLRRSSKSCTQGASQCPSMPSAFSPPFLLPSRSPTQFNGPEYSINNAEMTRS